VARQQRLAFDHRGALLLEDLLALALFLGLEVL
jgi:hypothetical protein